MVKAFEVYMQASFLYICCYPTSLKEALFDNISSIATVEFFTTEKKKKLCQIRNILNPENNR